MSQIIVLGAFGFFFACQNRSMAEEQITESQQPSDNSSQRHYTDLEKTTVPENVSSQVKRYEGFILSFNRDNRTPNWVGWELLRSEANGDVPRNDAFWQDTELDDCPTPADYKGSGYDRGHMVPAADQKWSEQAMLDCFSMANMCPQNHSLNSGAWNTLEKKERQWAQRDSAVVIVAGPIYDPTDTMRIGYGKVRVPSAFFKVMLAPYLAEPRAIAFVYPNMAAPGNMQQYVMTVDEVEKITGFDFFSSLPDDIESEVESKTSFKEWNRP